MTAGSGRTGVRRPVLADCVLWPPGGGEMLSAAAGRDTESPGEGPAEGFRAAEPARGRGLGHVAVGIEEGLSGFQAHLLDELRRRGVQLRREESAETARAHLRDRGEGGQHVLGPGSAETASTAARSAGCRGTGVRSGAENRGSTWR